MNLGAGMVRKLVADGLAVTLRSLAYLVRLLIRLHQTCPSYVGFFLIGSTESEANLTTSTFFRHLVTD